MLLHSGPLKTNFRTVKCCGKGQSTGHQDHRKCNTAGVWQDVDAWTMKPKMKASLVLSRHPNKLDVFQKQQQLPLIFCTPVTLPSVLHVITHSVPQ